MQVRETDEEDANVLEVIRTGDTCGTATFICTQTGTIITADVTSSTANATFARGGVSSVAGVVPVLVDDNAELVLSH